MSIAVDILQRELRAAENAFAAEDVRLKGAQREFRRCKHSRDLAAIRVTELQAAIITLGAKPDEKNA